MYSVVDHKRLLWYKDWLLWRIHERGENW